MRDMSRTVRRAAFRFGESLAAGRHRSRGRQSVHFLHIGKTGGSAVKFALRDDLLTPRYAIRLHRHGRKLNDVPTGQKVIFFLREPISRYVSGFYSRRREGRPKTFVPWSEAEKAAFEHFDSANALAEAISSSDEGERRRAHEAMSSIQHVRSSYRDWFISEEYFLRRSDDILFVGFQESLSDDFARLKSTLALPETVRLPTDDVHAHRNPSGIDTSLSATARQNLGAWYRADVEFLSLCRKMFGERPELREGRDASECAADGGATGRAMGSMASRRASRSR